MTDTDLEETDIIHKRKAEHIEISLNKDISFKNLPTGLNDYQFIHQALPEIDLESIDLTTNLFNKRLNAPLFISSMVGGIERALRINRNLALAAQVLGLGMGVGSQRCLIEYPETSFTYQVRDVAPDIFLCANIGAVQLNYQYGIKECLKAVEIIEADALILHLNPLQEALQKEGDTRFAGLINKIETICMEIDVPVIVKEVGFGISEDTALKLAEAGVSAIDTSGAGGTSWSEVEKCRYSSKFGFNVASAFADWGIPTSESIKMAKCGAPDIPIIASGGIKTGIDAAKAIGLGADIAGIALPLLKAADESSKKVIRIIKEIIEELRLSMFCIGAENINELKNTRLLKKMHYS
jgi:isopentenyl-diphosphate Delta-isomerase